MANPQQNSGSMNIDEQFKMLQLKMLQRQLQKEEEEERLEAERTKKRQAANLREVEDARMRAEQERRNQENCPHNSKGISFVRGQKLGTTTDEHGHTKNGFIAFCQICLKRYNSREEIPEHLRSDESFFGGPTNY